MNPSRTIRLHNTGSTNLSINLHQLRSPASGGMRRGLLLTPINITAGRFYDVCAQLNVSFNEAEQILARSPEIKLHKGHRLSVLEYPPPPEDAAPVAPAVVPERAAILSRPAREEPAAAPAPIVEPVMPAPEMLPEMEMLPAPEVMTETAPSMRPDEVDDVPVSLDEPSMTWSEERLRQYASLRDIDISKAKTKTALLRAVRNAR